MDSRGNEIWLGGIVGRDLLLLSTKGIWIWLGRMEILKVWCFNNGMRERAINDMND
jgi:hypothetical protein